MPFSSQQETAAAIFEQLKYGILFFHLSAACLEPMCNARCHLPAAGIFSGKSVKTDYFYITRESENHG
jgi:hypothetical protein